MGNAKEKLWFIGIGLRKWHHVNTHNEDGRCEWEDAQATPLPSDKLSAAPPVKDRCKQCVTALKKHTAERDSQ